MEMVLTKDFLQLTDDEVAGLGALTARPWPTPLPTVADDADALRAAAIRGIRSLLVRDLAGVAADGRPVAGADVSTVVETMHEGSLRIAVTAVSTDGSTPAFAWYSHGGADTTTWLTEGVTADGVRLLELTPREECLDAVRRTARDAHAKGLSDDGSRQLVVAVYAPDGGHLLRCDKGRVEVTALDSNGAEIDGPNSSLGLEAALSSILD
jgi:hypothetical protein